MFLLLGVMCELIRFLGLLDFGEVIASNGVHDIRRNEEVVTAKDIDLKPSNISAPQNLVFGSWG